MRTSLFARKQTQPQAPALFSHARPAAPAPRRANQPEAASGGTSSPLFGHDLSLIPIHPAAPAIQTKLAINQPGDIYEQEADYVSEQVMRTPGPRVARAAPSGGGHVQASPGQMAAPPIVHEVLRSPGQSLDPATSALMEQRIASAREAPGHRYDFSRVRVHSDSLAAESAEAIAARAYTAGRDIVFGPGQFSPHSSQGLHLLAHELVHVAQAAGQIRRTVKFDARSNPVSYEFKIGTDVTEPFAKEAQRLVADDNLSDPDIIKLKGEAVRDRETVSDAERVLMAGLLDRANIRRLKATTIGAATAFTFPLASITPARMAHVINVDRTALPASVAKPLADAAKAAGNLDPFNALANVSKAEVAATAEIATQAGTAFATQGAALLAFIAANSILATNTLKAMLAAASDNDPGDKVFAGIVYAVAAQVGSVMADDIFKGSIKVDALTPASFAAMGGVSFQNALYIGAAPINPAQGSQKGDTVYLRNDTKIDSVRDRSVIIHELRHAQDDKALPAGGKVTFPIQQDLELTAYKAQALYVLDQMSVKPATEQAKMAKDATTPENDGILIGGLIVGKSNLTKYQPLLELLFAAVAPPARQNAAGVATMLALPTTRLEAVLLDTIRKGYRITATTKTVMEGQAGESVIHWIRRL